uniref:DUF1279 domain-containing protein n=1 Tax=Polytomella parva TaxID=51329 RepID=A0A7S0URE8_9CHLO|mmetsp:Transcript_13912/g.24410  ORF Transcript_13912/g.24410 Transcript_13912/m.24410 type:complete len:120 (+) Transcript_13912:40-399(+)
MSQQLNYLKTSYQKLKGGLQKYGKTGLFTYIGLSACVTTGFYVAIENNVDVAKLLGIKSDPNKEPGFAEKYLLGKGSSIALAIICSKMLVPLKLPAALALTPYVQRFLERMGAASQKVR